MKTILVVDDEYGLVENLSELLQYEGYRVVSAGNGKDGFARAQEETPDLLITDFMMPIANGDELVRSMQRDAKLEHVPVIMMSATLRKIALADETLRVATFLKKPFQWKQLLDAVVALIGPGTSEPGQR